jgi:hypothetical protein
MSFDLAWQATLALTIAVAGCGRFHFEVTLGDGSSDGALAPGSCNGIDRIADDFEDGVQGDIWDAAYASAGTSYAETGGELVLTLAPNAAAYVGYSATYFYDLRNNRTFAELVQAPGPGAVAGLSADYTQLQYLHINVRDGVVTASQDIAGTFSVVATIPYDAAMHRFLGFEERDGQLYFETSADGVTFTPFTQEADPFDLSLMRPEVYAGTQTPVPSPGVARFGSFNGTATGLGGCPISTLVDHFDDGIVPGHEWENSYVDPCCTDSETGGVLAITTDGSVGQTARRSSAGYDLREGHIAVAVTMAPTGSARAGLVITRANGDNVIYDVRATTIAASKTIGGTNTTVFSVPRDASLRYIQIRESGGTLYLEASPDRTAWQPMYSTPLPFAVDDVGVTLQGGIGGTAGAADSMAFDDLGP